MFIAFGVVLILIGVSAIVVVVRRQLADPRIRAPRRTDTAVRRALRDGHADDPRTDALARSAAARAIRQRWVLWFLPLGVLLFGTGTVTDLRDPDTTWWDLGVSAVWTAIPAYVLVHQLVQLRRSRRYLGRSCCRTPSTNTPDTTGC